VIEFDAIIPENMQKSLSNGTIRLQFDVDKSQAFIIPKLIDAVGHMFHIVMVTHEEACEIAQKRKTPHGKLLGKVHVLFGEVGKKYNLSMEEYKKRFKEKNNITISFSDMDEDSMAGVCEKLETFL